ncbi:HNH endonuclease family protein [Bdellovibrio sp. HCB2-146]|uniref:HNH endonuclease family protein n=1 Tax=Bdellovibrio sp. HCB2-146 TaxID=3394362 RepID=UPI0039BD12AF
MKKLLLVLASISSFTVTAHADYFTVSEEISNRKPTSAFAEPQEIIEESWQVLEKEFSELRAIDFSLLKFIQHSGNYGETSERYNRAKHFGTWIRGHEGTCLNTRGLVLERDSDGPVSYTSNGCSVATGNWHDPYAGDTFKQASDIQIDHFVPLKNAFISGAAEWNAKKRCLYANYLGNNFHLLAVLGTENNRKSDKTPEGYMPPNPQYRCQYLVQWLKIKMIWHLNLSVSEKESIVKLVKENNCNLRQFSYPSAELEQQRDFIADNQNLCQ